MNVQTALLDVRRMGQADRLTIAACTPATELMENANKAVARELNSHRIRTFQLDGFVDFFISSCFVHFRKPDADIFRVALDIAQAPAHQVVYLEDQPMFVEIAESPGIRGIRHTDYESTCAKLAAFGLQHDEGVIHETCLGIVKN